MPLNPTASAHSSTPAPPELIRRVTAAFSRGLNTRPSPLHLDALQSPVLQGWRLVGTELRKPYGFLRLGTDTLAVTSGSEAATRIFYFVNAFGTARIVALNSQRGFIYNTGAATWDEFTGTGGGAAPNATDAFTGGATDVWDIAVAASTTAPGTLDPLKNLFCFTNGLDAPMCWDGDATLRALAITNAPICRYLAYFGDRLIAAHTTEGGNRRATRIRWPVSGNILDWTGLGSGAVDRPASGYEIRNLKPIRGQCAVYYNSGVELMRVTGASQAPFSFHPLPGPGIGLLAPHSLRATPTGDHFFLGSDFNVYGFDSASLTPLGNDIRDDIEASIDVGFLRNVIAEVVPQDSEYWLAIPTAETGGFPFQVYVVNWRTNAWTKHSISGLSTLGFATDPIAPPTWNDLTALGTTWANLTGTWDSLLTSAGNTPRLLIGLTDATVHKDDRTSITYAIASSATPFQSVVDTPSTDFGEPDRLKTLQRIRIRYRSHTTRSNVTFRCHASVNGGVTFEATAISDIISPSGDGTLRTALADFFLTGTTHLVRIEPSDALANISIVEVSLEALIGGVAVAA